MPHRRTVRRKLASVNRVGLMLQGDRRTIETESVQEGMFAFFAARKTPFVVSKIATESVGDERERAVDPVASSDQ